MATPCRALIAECLGVRMRVRFVPHASAQQVPGDARHINTHHDALKDRHLAEYATPYPLERSSLERAIAVLEAWLAAPDW